ncbi:MAG: Coenzyme F420 hydrogenase/dehydrogenase, beta subunit C-terminal domain [Methanobacteriaceae archaeon]|jgi:coenzyme F420-reducing hydrogenase beta subunit|nr:Coenzyme F420 hydrogenase/dehydrogenase, beta subunit C-terminal domain [Candidatus Methanorudis spinitermitis]
MEKTKKLMKEILKKILPESAKAYYRKKRNSRKKSKKNKISGEKINLARVRRIKRKYKRLDSSKSSLKIGLVSINTHSKSLNLACALHSFVFSEVLTGLGYKNVVVDYYQHYHNKNTDLRFPLIKLLKSNNDSKKNQEEIKMWTEMFYQRMERFDKFQEFVKKHYNLTKNTYTAISLDQISNAEDINCYIAVTDVIWKNYKKFGFDKGFFLNCHAMENAYKIAYSTSRGPSKYQEKATQEEFLDYIKNIDEISVREKNLANYISSVSDINAEVVIDPTFLMDKDYYKKLLIKPNKKGYVLVYLAMSNSYELVSLAAKFAEEHNLDLIELSEFYTNQEQIGYSRHSVIYNVGVEEWIGYIDNADYVFTNSFHGICLSVILEKQFFSGKRGLKLDSLMETFNLEHRKAMNAFGKGGKMIAKDIDYDLVNEIREKIVDKSMKFLKNALKNADSYVQEYETLNCDYLSIKDKYSCTCCTACEKICPEKAIRMVQDDEGFYFPEIDKNKCTDCESCNKVCPYNNKKLLYSKPIKTCLTYNKNENDRKNSSSGGMYAAMADYILKQGGAIIGVRFNDKWEVLYDIAETKEDCSEFRYSKYVEAMDNDIYIKTKNVLKTGRKVLFTGTPCKISGLLNYLDKSYDNLYCVDIICNGTNSPILFEKYLSEKQKNSPLKHFQFRSPKASQESKTVEYVYENGETELLNLQEDLYMRSFLKNLMLKRSCYDCLYSGNNGISDITFGDFLGGKELIKEDDAENGISSVKINTPKGQTLFENMDVYSQKQTINQMYAENHKKSPELPIQRDKIFEIINKDKLTVTDAFKKVLDEIEGM